MPASANKILEHIKARAILGAHAAFGLDDFSCVSLFSSEIMFEKHGAFRANEPSARLLALAAAPAAADLRFDFSKAAHNGLFLPKTAHLAEAMGVALYAAEAAALANFARARLAQAARNVSAAASLQAFYSPIARLNHEAAREAVVRVANELRFRLTDPNAADRLLLSPDDPALAARRERGRREVLERRVRIAAKSPPDEGLRRRIEALAGLGYGYAPFLFGFDFAHPALRRDGAPLLDSFKDRSLYGAAISRVHAFLDTQSRAFGYRDKTGRLDRAKLYAKPEELRAQSERANIEAALARMGLPADAAARVARRHGAALGAFRVLISPALLAATDVRKLKFNTSTFAALEAQARVEGGAAKSGPARDFLRHAEGLARKRTGGEVKVDFWLAGAGQAAKAVLTLQRRDDGCIRAQSTQIVVEGFVLLEACAEARPAPADAPDQALMTAPPLDMPFPW